MKNLGEKIRKIRVLKHYSQDYMADRLNMSQTAYSDLETNKTKISMERLDEIGNIFDMKTEEILAFDEHTIFNNTFNEKSQGFFNVKKYITESFEYERQQYKEQIEILKNEIVYLRKKLDEK